MDNLPGLNNQRVRTTDISSACHSYSAVEPVDGSVDASVDGSQPVDISHNPQFMADTSQLRHPTQSVCLDAGLSTSLLTAENSNREFLAHAVFIDDSSDANDDPCDSWKQVCGL